MIGYKQISTQRFGCLLILVMALGAAACAGQNRPPILLSAAPLTYPSAAQRDGVEGYVTLRYRVNEAGAVVGAQVVAAEPPGVFDAAARAAVSAWRFSPAETGGQPVMSAVRESTLTFKLGDTEQYRRD